MASTPALTSRGRRVTFTRLSALDVKRKTSPSGTVRLCPICSSSDLAIPVRVYHPLLEECPSVTFRRRLRVKPQPPATREVLLGGYLTPWEKAQLARALEVLLAAPRLWAKCIRVDVCGAKTRPSAPIDTQLGESPPGDSRR